MSYQISYLTIELEKLANDIVYLKEIISQNLLPEERLDEMKFLYTELLEQYKTLHNKLNNLKAAKKTSPGDYSPGLFSASTDFCFFFCLSAFFSAFFLSFAAFFSALTLSRSS